VSGCLLSLPGAFSYSMATAVAVAVLLV